MNEKRTKRVAPKAAWITMYSLASVIGLFVATLSSCAASGATGCATDVSTRLANQSEPRQFGRAVTHGELLRWGADDAVSSAEGRPRAHTLLASTVVPCELTVRIRTGSGALPAGQDVRLAVNVGVPGRRDLYPRADLYASVNDSKALPAYSIHVKRIPLNPCPAWAAPAEAPFLGHPIVNLFRFSLPQMNSVDYHWTVEAISFLWRGPADRVPTLYAVYGGRSPFIFCPNDCAENPGNGLTLNPPVHDPYGRRPDRVFRH